MNVKKVLKKIDDFLHKYIGRTRVLFEVSNVYGWACQKPVYDQLKKIEVENGLYLATTIGEREFDIFDESLEEGLYDNLIKIDRARWMKWHYIIHTDVSGIYFFRNSINVMMLHGAAYGTVESNYNAKMFLSNDCDLYFGVTSL